MTKTSKYQFWWLTALLLLAFFPSKGSPQVSVTWDPYAFSGFSNGFESGDVDLSDGDGVHWDGGDRKGATISGGESSTTFSGTYSAKLAWTDGGQTAFTYHNIASENDFFIQYRLRVDSFSVNGRTQFRLASYKNNPRLLVDIIRITPGTYGLDLYFTTSDGWQVIHGKTQLKFGIWNTIEAHFRAGTPASGGAEYWINGVLEGSDLFQNTFFPTAAPNRINIGLNWSAYKSAGVIYLDNIRYSPTPISNQGFGGQSPSDFEDGFESGDPDLSDGDGFAWDGGGGKGAVFSANETSNTFSGTYSGKLVWTDGGQNAYAFRHITPANEFYIQYRLRVESFSVNGRTQFRLASFKNTPRILADIIRIAPGIFRLDLYFLTEKGWVSLRGKSNLNNGEWYKVQAHFKAGDPVAGGGEYWINDILEGGNFNHNTSYTNAAPDRINLGLNWTAYQSSGVVFVDKIKYSTTNLINISKKDIWQIKVSPNPQTVLFDGHLGIYQSSIAELGSSLDWFWESDHLFIYSTSDPNNGNTLITQNQVCLETLPESCSPPTSSFNFTYYVDATNGNDNNDGRSPEFPWKSLGKVNRTLLKPGESIGFKAGETWREILIPPSSGAEGVPIIFGSYGVGEKPKISGSEIINGWSTTAAPDFSEDFESANLSAWSSTSGIGYLDSISAHNGVYGFHSDFWSPALIKTFSPVPKARAGFFLNVKKENFVEGSKTPVGYFMSGSRTVGKAYIFKTGGNLYLDFVDGTSPGTGKKIIPSRWYKVEFETSVHSDKGSLKMWVDGGLAVDRTGLNMGSGGISSLVLGPTENQHNEVDLHYDDINLYLNQSMTVWKASVPVRPKEIWFEGVIGTITPCDKGDGEVCPGVHALEQVDSPGDWYWESGLLYVYSSSDPDAQFTSPGIESAKRENVVLISSKSHLIFDGLEVVHSNGWMGTGSGAFEIERSSRKITIQNSSIHDHNWNAIWVEGAPGREVSEISILGNEIFNTNFNQLGGGAIHSNYMDRSLIANNVIHHTQEHGIRFWHSDFNTVENNILHSNGSAGLTMASGGDTLNPNQGNIIRFNLAYNNSLIDPTKANFECIDTLLSAKPNQYYYNVSYDSKNHGFNIAGADGDIFYNNTVVQSENRGFNIWNSSYITVKNNIVTESGVAHIRVNAGAITGHQIDFNLYGNDFKGGFHWNGTWQKNFADWKGNSGQDQHSPTPQAPLFKDPANSDFGFTPSSPAINAGTAFGINEGASTVDLGAFQFSK